MRDPLHLTLLLPSPVFDRSVRFGPRDVRHNHLTALGRGGGHVRTRGGRGVATQVRKWERPFAGSHGNRFTCIARYV